MIQCLKFWILHIEVNKTFGTTFLYKDCCPELLIVTLWRKYIFVWLSRLFFFITHSRVSLYTDLVESWLNSFSGTMLQETHSCHYYSSWMEFGFVIFIRKNNGRNRTAQSRNISALGEKITTNTCELSKFMRRGLMIFIIKGFQTIVFIFIVISSTFRSICPPTFFRCLSNSGTFTNYILLLYSRTHIHIQIYAET